MTIKTQGNFVVHGKEGERIAAFATREDMETFKRFYDAEETCRQRLGVLNRVQTERNLLLEAAEGALPTEKDAAIGAQDVRFAILRSAVEAVRSGKACVVSILSPLHPACKEKSS